MVATTRRPANEIIGLTVLAVLCMALIVAEARPADASVDPEPRIASADVDLSFRHDGE